MARHVTSEGLDFTELAGAPGAPTTGRVRVYAKADGKLYIKDDAGVETDLTAAGGGGGGAAAINQVEVDLGSEPRRSGSFTIADGTIAAGTQINVIQAADAYTGKGTLTDEAEMDHVNCAAVVTGAGAATVYWRADSFVRGNFRFNWIAG